MGQRITRVFLALFFCALARGRAQDTYHRPISVVEDWSTHQVIFSENVPEELKPTVMADSRFWLQYFRRHASYRVCAEPEGRQDESLCPRDPLPGSGWQVIRPAKRDWSVSLGGGSGGPISEPAIFTYDVSAAPNCTGDYAVTGIDVAGASGTQANIIGLNNLYVNGTSSGYCYGSSHLTAPTVLFSYFVGTGNVQSSPVISLDGKKVAFVENSSTSSKLHILTIGTTGTNGTSATAPVAVGSAGGNNAVDTQVGFTSTSSTAPFIDYDDDVAYVSTNGTASIVHKITGVFRGIPTEVTTNGWPATISGNPSISTPVFDFTSKHVIMLDAAGSLDYVDDSVSPAVTHSAALSIASTGINATPVVIDSSRKLVYAIANNPNGTHALVAQANTSLTSASLVTVNIGTGTGNLIRQVDFNNSYYTGAPYTSCFMYVVGNDSGLFQGPALFDVAFSNSSFVLNTTTANGPLALTTGLTSGVNTSPLTEFYNSTTSKDYMFVSVTNACESTGITGGCIRSLNITNGFPTSGNVNSVVLAASGGTGRASVDNYANTTTYPGASSIYYTTLSGNTLVKATQAGLQ